MSFARYSRTPAQRGADQWQHKVDELTSAIKGGKAIAERGQLTAKDAAHLQRLEQRLAKLMAENPNEPA